MNFGSSPECLFKLLGYHLISLPSRFRPKYFWKNIIFYSKEEQKIFVSSKKNNELYAMV